MAFNLEEGVIWAWKQIRYHPSTLRALLTCFGEVVKLSGEVLKLFGHSLFQSSIWVVNEQTQGVFVACFRVLLNHVISNHELSMSVTLTLPQARQSLKHLGLEGVRGKLREETQKLKIAKRAKILNPLAISIKQQVPCLKFYLMKATTSLPKIPTMHSIGTNKPEELLSPSKLRNCTIDCDFSCLSQFRDYSESSKEGIKLTGRSKKNSIPSTNRASFQKLGFEKGLFPKIIKEQSLLNQDYHILGCGGGSAQRVIPDTPSKLLSQRFKKALLLINSQKEMIKELTEVSEKQSKEVRLQLSQIKELNLRVKALQCLREIPLDIRQIYAKMQNCVKNQHSFQLRELKYQDAIEKLEERIREFEMRMKKLKQEREEREQKFKESIVLLQEEYTQKIEKLKLNAETRLMVVRNELQHWKQKVQYFEARKISEEEQWSNEQSEGGSHYKIIMTSPQD